MNERKDSWTLMSALAVPGIALMVMGVRRRSALLVAGGAFVLGRAASLIPKGLFNP